MLHDRLCVESVNTILHGRLCARLRVVLGVLRVESVNTILHDRLRVESVNTIGYALSLLTRSYTVGYVRACVLCWVCYCLIFVSVEWL